MQSGHPTPNLESISLQPLLLLLIKCCRVVYCGSLPRLCWMPTVVHVLGFGPHGGWNENCIVCWTLHIEHHFFNLGKLCLPWQWVSMPSLCHLCSGVFTFAAALRFFYFCLSLHCCTVVCVPWRVSSMMSLGYCWSKVPPKVPFLTMLTCRWLSCLTSNVLSPGLSFRFITRVVFRT